MWMHRYWVLYCSVPQCELCTRCRRRGNYATFNRARHGHTVCPSPRKSRRPYTDASLQGTLLNIGVGMGQNDAKPIDQGAYDLAFQGKQRRAALERALDIRKFEIELYWKRATYFWVFSGATFAGYATLAASKGVVDQTLLAVVSCVGFIFSFAWVLANKGSKQWQENWENHVDLLENDVIGPLFKTVLRRPAPALFAQACKEAIAGPASFSVSAINQIVSLFVAYMWLFLFGRALPTFVPHWEYAVPATLGGLALITCATFVWAGRTYRGNHTPKGTRRTSIIQAPTLHEADLGDQEAKSRRADSPTLRPRVAQHVVLVLLGLLIACAGNAGKDALAAASNGPEQAREVSGNSVVPDCGANVIGGVKTGWMEPPLRCHARSPCTTQGCR